MNEATPTFAHRAEYALFAGAIAAGTLFSDRMASRLGAAVGRLGYRPLGLRRGRVEDNLRRAFPERDDAWVQSIAAASYAHLGREALAMLRLARTSPDRVLDRVERVDGLEHARALHARGKGIVLVAGHIGNWEIGGAIIAALGLPLDIVAQRQHNPLFDRAIVRARERLGVRVIERSRATKLALRSLRQGRVVAFAADQNAGAVGVFVPFFGRLASTHRGPAVMALRTGAPILLALPLRLPSGGYHMRFEEIVVDRGGEAEAAVHRITAAFTARLEAAVRSAPEQYLWHHRRWKTRPREERTDRREV